MAVICHSGSSESGKLASGVATWRPNWMFVRDSESLRGHHFLPPPDEKGEKTVQLSGDISPQVL